ncbi:MAG: phosphotransferase family protein [Hyphomicrobiaceae bacterium]
MSHQNRPRTLDSSRLDALAAWLAASIGARAVVFDQVELLSGGAIGENWRLDLSVTDGPRAGRHAWVLRTDAASRMAMSHDRASEFALIRAAAAAGVRVPEPIAVMPDAALIGAPFMIVGHVAGSAQARRIVRDPRLPEFGDDLARSLGAELARLHAIRPPVADLAFLALPSRPPARAAVAAMRADLDRCSEPRPALEYVLGWLDRNAPDPQGLVLAHGDFRTGNYMIDGGRLTAILDWEFAHWGDRHEDLGWFTARCWRFGADEREAGGIARAEALYEGYESAGGDPVDRAAMPYWRILASARWAVVALLQGERHLTGGETSLELLLTGMMAPEMEYDALLGIEALEEGAR